MNDERRQLQERLVQLLRDPGAGNAEAEDLYLRFVAPKAWEIAWSGYQREGRGAVVFDLRGRRWRDALNKPIDSYYVAESILNQEGEDLDAAIEVAVGTYDPRHEFVCIVLYDEGPSCSRLSRRDLAA